MGLTANGGRGGGIVRESESFASSAQSGSGVESSSGFVQDSSDDGAVHSGGRRPAAGLARLSHQSLTMTSFTTIIL